MRIALVLLAWCGLGLLSALAADKNPNSACLECHSDKTLTKTNAAGKEVSLFVDEARLKATIHKTNTCADCHADITSKHPDDNVPAQPPSCVKCHERASQGIRHQHPWREPQAGRFRRGQLLGLPRLARHPAGQGPRLARLQAEPARHLRQMPQQPRADAGIPDEVSPGGGAVHGQHPRARACSRWASSSPPPAMTATASTTSNGPWTANRPSTTPTSPRPAANATSASRRPTTRASTASSWPRATSAARSAPIATPPTKSRPPRTATSRWPATSAAANATQDRLEHYRDTYHGKAMALGKPNVASDVAACYDCHGHHDVLPPSNPGLASLQGQHPGHLPAMPSRRDDQASPNTSPTPIRSTARIIRCCTRSSSA